MFSMFVPGGFLCMILSIRTFLVCLFVCLVDYCRRFMLYATLYAVLLRRSCVRLVKPLACFGRVVWSRGGGSEAFLLGTCPAG